MGEQQEKKLMEKIEGEEEKLNNVNIIDKQHLAGLAVLSELIKTEEQSNEERLKEESLEKAWLKQLDDEEFEINSKKKVEELYLENVVTESKAIQQFEESNKKMKLKKLLENKWMNNIEDKEKLENLPKKLDE